MKRRDEQERVYDMTYDGILRLCDAREVYTLVCFSKKIEMTQHPQCLIIRDQYAKDLGIVLQRQYVLLICNHVALASYLFPHHRVMPIRIL